MATNYGLLGGIADGVKEGLIAYQTARNAKRQEQQYNALNGIQGFDENDQPIYTPEMQEQRRVHQLKIKGEAEEFDPNSEASKRSAGILAKISSGEKVTPEDIQGTSVHTQKQIQSTINQGMKSDLANEMHLDRLDRQTTAREEKRKKQEEEDKRKTNERFTAFGKYIDANASRAGNFGKMAAMDQASQRIDKLFGQFPDYNVPKSQTAELATATAGMISGGSPQSQHQIDLLIPSSLRGDSNAIAAWVTNKPRGQQQQAFMKLMHETAKREGDLARDQMAKVITGRIGEFSDLNEKDRNRYLEILENKGINPNTITKSGRYNPEEARHEVISAAPPTKGAGLLSQDIQPEQSSISGLLSPNLQQTQSQSVRMVDPKGNIRLVPIEQVPAAKAAGGKVVE